MGKVKKLTIKFTEHATKRIQQRGCSQSEVREAIEGGIWKRVDKL